MLPLPLTTLIKQLRAAGFPLDPGREMRLRRVVHERGADYVGRFAEMKYLLAPFVASRPEEQRNFYAFWDRHIAELEQKWVDEEKDEPVGDLPGASGWRWLLLPLLCLVAYGAYRYFNPKPPPPVGEHYAINIGLPGAAADSVYEKQTRLTEGDTLRLLNRTQGELGEADSTGFMWRVENTHTGALERTYRTFDMEMARPLVQGEGLRAILVGDHLGLPKSKSSDTMFFVVQCAEPPSKLKIKVAEGTIEVGATHGFAITEPEEGVTYNWAFGTKELKGASVRHAFTTEGPFTISVQAVRGGPENMASCYTLAFVDVQVMPKGDDLPILASLPLVGDEPHTFAARSFPFKWGKWLLLGLVLGPLLWWKHRRETEARREKTDEEIAEAYPIFDQGPYNIPYRSKNDQVSAPADFYRIADQLRVREASERQVFDGAATIEATVNSGGFPSWRERSLNRPADYLVLVTHNDEFNQQDLLLKRLTDFLTVREAAITVYYHEGQFEHFWNKEHPQGWSADRLYDRYQQYRLLVLGNAHGLVDVYASHEPQLEPTKAKWLGGWARRLVLTTEPAEDWTAQEVLLYRAALLYPITMRGLNEGIRMLNVTEEYEPQDFKKWRTLQQRNNPEPTARYRQWETVADHEDYLQADPEQMRWLRGLAVTGNPDWSLTIAIGRALNIEVTHDRLLQLSRIPWLAGNQPDHDLRFALLKGIAPADEAAARAAVIKELALVEGSVRGAFAQTEWQTNLAVHQLHLAPASAPQKELLREMIRAGLFTTDQLRDLELAAQRKEQPVEQVQTKAGPRPPKPGGLDRLLAKDARNWWNTDPGKRFIGTLVILTGLGLFALSQLTPERQLAEGEDAPWWAEETVVDDEALKANNEAVYLWIVTDRSIRSKYGEIDLESATSFSLIKSKLKEARDLRGGTYPLAEQNEQRAFYNERAYRSNAAFLDLASDKEAAFRDLIEEAVPEDFVSVRTGERLWADFIHQDGVALLGLYQTLTNEYPLGRVSRTQMDQLKKEFPDIRLSLPVVNNEGLAEGRLPDGRDVGKLRTERDSLLTGAATTLRNIENLMGVIYFDSLTRVMPVNLRTMVNGILAAQNGNGPDDVPQQQQQDEATATDPVQSTPPATNPPVEEATEPIPGLVVLDLYRKFRYNQVVNYETTSGREQSSNLSGFTNFFQRNSDKAFSVIDYEVLLDSEGGNFYDGVGHDDEGFVLLMQNTEGLNTQDDAFVRELKKNTHVLVASTDHSFNPAIPADPSLVTNTNKFVAVSKSLGFNVTALSNPSLAELRRAISNLNRRKLGKNSQLIVVLNLQATDDGSILLGGGKKPIETFSSEGILELKSITEQAGHSLFMSNYLVIKELPIPQDQSTKPLLSSLSSSELFSLIQKSEHSSALTPANNVMQKAANIESVIKVLIGDLVQRSGGYEKGTSLKSPDNTEVVEYFIKESAGALVAPLVDDFGKALTSGYIRLRRGSDAALSTITLLERFTDPSLGGQKWHIGAFAGKNVSEAILILEEVSIKARAAEKAYLLALAESLNLGEE